jgi:hypothetical protein
MAPTTDPEAGPPDHLVAQCLAAYDTGEDPGRALEGAAVRATLALLRERAPGASVEVRIPPYAAVQVIAGARHRRGTPPAVVETDARTWLRLAGGHQTWAEAERSGALRASGERSDLSALLPLT